CWDWKLLAFSGLRLIASRRKLRTLRVRTVSFASASLGLERSSDGNLARVLRIIFEGSSEACVPPSRSGQGPGVLPPTIYRAPTALRSTPAALRVGMQGLLVINRDFIAGANIS